MGTYPIGSQACKAQQSGNASVSTADLIRVIKRNKAEFPSALLFLNFVERRRLLVNCVNGYDSPRGDECPD
jgi:hypothetical protein